MEVRISMNPAVLKLGMLLSLTIVIGLYSSVLIGVKKGKGIDLCTSNKTRNETCWNGKLMDIKRTMGCPFTLNLVAVIFFSFSLFLFIVLGIVKCLYPEFVLMAYRTHFSRIFYQYYMLVLHLIATCFCSAFLVIILISSYHNRSCYFSADMLKNCINHRSLCWMFCFTVVGFIGSFVATMFSIFEARKFYVERLEDEMCDQLYDEYLINGPEREILRTWPE